MDNPGDILGWLYRLIRIVDHTVALTYADVAGVLVPHYGWCGFQTWRTEPTRLPSFWKSADSLLRNDVMLQLDFVAMQSRN